MSPVTRVLIPLGMLVAAAGCLDELGSYEGGGGVGEGGSGQTTTLVASGGFGGVTGGEDCQNGRDDDGDELIDCEDIDCGGYYCIPAPTGDFAGSAILLSAGDCNPAFPDVGPSGKIVASAPDKCPCSCGNAAGGTCSATVQFFDAAGCGNLVATENASGVCDAVATPQAAAARADAQPGGGACAPSSETAAAPTFEDRATCTGRVGGGCEEGFVCARPAADSPFCFYAQGDVECEGVYDQKIVVFEGTPVDDRECQGSCDCDPASGGACGGQLVLKDSCAGSTIDSSPLGACEPFAAPATVGGIDASSLTVTSQGTCGVVPRVQTGGFTGPGTTLCCADEI